MHVLAMRKYPAVERFLKLAPKAASKVQEVPLPPVNMSSLRNAEVTADKWARLDAMDTSKPVQETTEMSLPVFNAFLSFFKS